MQAAGGIDWMVAMAARVIESHPRQITVIAPLTAFAFCVGSGTGNIIYQLLPVIYDVSYKNHIRPARPLTLTVVQSGMALAASPVSAAMAAMLTLTELAPYNLGPTQILAITLPACSSGSSSPRSSSTACGRTSTRTRRCRQGSPPECWRLLPPWPPASERPQRPRRCRARRPERPTRSSRWFPSRVPTWPTSTPTCRPSRSP